MANVKEQVKSLFKSNGAYKTLYAFDDGNIFSDVNFAKNHQRTSKKDYSIFNREDFNYSEPSAKPVKEKTSDKGGKKDNAPKISIKDQLKDIDLDKCEGKDYPILKALRDGLGIKTEDNKFPTIVEALKKAKAELNNGGSNE